MNRDGNLKTQKEMLEIKNRNKECFGAHQYTGCDQRIGKLEMSIEISEIKMQRKKMRMTELNI